jgi:hypothetical protein
MAFFWTVWTLAWREWTMGNADSALVLVDADRWSRQDDGSPTASMT